MSDAFDRAFEELVGLEGRFSDDENDPGNWTGGAKNKGVLKGTKFGVSAKAYPDLDIVNLSLFDAKKIYLRDYWAKLHCDALPDCVAVALFKEGVNLGVDGAAKALQRALRVVVDGDIGQVTIGSAHAQPPKEIMVEFLTQCAYDYTKMPNFIEDGKGWLARVIKTAVEATYE